MGNEAALCTHKSAVIVQKSIVVDPQVDHEIKKSGQGPLSGEKRDSWT